MPEFHHSFNSATERASNRETNFGESSLALSKQKQKRRTHIIIAVVIYLFICPACGLLETEETHDTTFTMKIHKSEY